jgi:hypothetical protein
VKEHQLVEGVKMSAEVSYWFEHQEYGVQPGTLWDENKDGIDKLRGGRFAEGVETDEQWSHSL